MIYSSSLFTWNKATKTFVAEISDFGSKGLELSRSIIDTSIDLGFRMVSQKSGNEVSFFHNMTRHDDDGDVICWEFLPVNKKYNFKVVIYND